MPFGQGVALLADARQVGQHLLARARRELAHQRFVALAPLAQLLLHPGGIEAAELARQGCITVAIAALAVDHRQQTGVFLARACKLRFGAGDPVEGYVFGFLLEAGAFLL